MGILYIGINSNDARYLLGGNFFSEYHSHVNKDKYVNYYINEAIEMYPSEGQT